MCKAFEAGYADPGNVATDTDLDALRARADFQALLNEHATAYFR